MADRLSVERREDFALASVMARKGVGAERLADALGVMPPSGPHAATAGGLTLIGAGPGTWLAHADRPDPAFAADLRARLAGLAAVSDQSSGYVLYRLAGPGARRLLQRGAAIDLHPAVFAPGSAATTVIAHMGVILWQVDDAPTYDVALFRSFAGSFAHWLEVGARAL